MLEQPINSVDSSFQNTDLISFKHVLEKAKEKGVDLSFNDIKEIQKQTQEVRARYFGTKEWLKAPNGQDTKLTEGQWLSVRTPNFKAWFGDWEKEPREASKAIDLKTGEPLVLYHGTDSDFEEFKTASEIFQDPEDISVIYFTGSIKDAESHSYSSSFVSNEPQTIYPVFLNIRKPKSDSLWKSITLRFSKYKSHDRAKSLAHLNNRDVKILKDLGFDGIIDRDKDVNYFIILYSNQVKSATGNIGTFSKNADDISI